MLIFIISWRLGATDSLFDHKEPHVHTHKWFLTSTYLSTYLEHTLSCLFQWSWGFRSLIITSKRTCARLYLQMLGCWIFLLSTKPSTTLLCLCLLLAAWWCSGSTWACQIILCREVRWRDQWVTHSSSLLFFACLSTYLPQGVWLPWKRNKQFGKCLEQSSHTQGLHIYIHTHTQTDIWLWMVLGQNGNLIYLSLYLRMSWYTKLFCKYSSVIGKGPSPVSFIWSNIRLAVHISSQTI